MKLSHTWSQILWTLEALVIQRLLEMDDVYYKYLSIAMYLILWQNIIALLVLQCIKQPPWWKTVVCFHEVWGYDPLIHSLCQPVYLNCIFLAFPGSHFINLFSGCSQCIVFTWLISPMGSFHYRWVIFKPQFLLQSDWL